jgi:hypothetical protein
VNLFSSNDGYYFSFGRAMDGQSLKKPLNKGFLTVVAVFAEVDD